jgi:hypothetical protein
MKYLLPLLLLTGCAVKETHLQPINDALSKQQQYLLAVINAHNTLATCLKDNDTVKAIKECVAKSYEKKGALRKVDDINTPSNDPGVGTLERNK